MSKLFYRIVLFAMLFMSGFAHAQWESIPIPGVVSDAGVGLQNMGAYLVWTGLHDGVFISPDTGKTWRKATDIVNNPTRRGMAANGNSIFVATDGGLFISRDTGTTWAMEKTIGAVSVGSVRLMNGLLIAGTPANGLFYSQDGLTWLNVHPEKYIKAFHFDADFYVLTTAGFYTSKHPSGTWTLQQDTIQKVGIDFVTKFNGRLFMNSYAYGILSSSDEGKTWVQSVKGLDASVTSKTQLNYITKILDTSKDVFAASYGKGVFISRDGGNTWFRFHYGISPSNKDEGQDIYLAMYGDAFNFFGGYIFGGTYKNEIVVRRKLSDCDGILNMGNGLLLSPSYPLTGARYQWYLDDQLLTDSNAYKINAVQNGTYKMVIDFTAQARPTETYTYNLQDMAITSTDPGTDGEDLSVFPNPSQGRLSAVSSGGAIHYLRIVDLHGNIVFQQQELSDPGEKQFDISFLPKGTYLLTVECSGKKKTRPLVLE